MHKPSKRSISSKPRPSPYQQVIPSILSGKGLFSNKKPINKDIFLEDKGVKEIGKTEFSIIHSKFNSKNPLNVINSKAKPKINDKSENATKNKDLYNKNQTISNKIKDFTSKNEGISNQYKPFKNNEEISKKTTNLSIKTRGIFIKNNDYSNKTTAIPNKNKDPSSKAGILYKNKDLPNKQLNKNPPKSSHLPLKHQNTSNKSLYNNLKNPLYSNSAAFSKGISGTLIKKPISSNKGRSITPHNPASTQNKQGRIIFGEVIDINNLGELRNAAEEIEIFINNYHNSLLKSEEISRIATLDPFDLKNCEKLEKLIEISIEIIKKELFPTLNLQIFCLILNCLEDLIFFEGNEIDLLNLFFQLKVDFKEKDEILAVFLERTGKRLFLLPTSQKAKFLAYFLDSFSQAKLPIRKVKKLTQIFTKDSEFRWMLSQKEKEINRIIQMAYLEKEIGVISSIDGKSAFGLIVLGVLARFVEFKIDRNRWIKEVLKTLPEFSLQDQRIWKGMVSKVIRSEVLKEKELVD